MFCMSVEIWPHLDSTKWVPSFWTLRMLEIWAWDQSGTLLQGHGAHDSGSSFRGTKDLHFRPKNIGTDETSNPRFNSFSHLKNKINLNKISKLVSYLTENTPSRDIWGPSRGYCENFCLLDVTPYILVKVNHMCPVVECSGFLSTSSRHSTLSTNTAVLKLRDRYGEQIYISILVPMRRVNSNRGQNAKILILKLCGTFAQ
jgi:hypothetical protein